MNLTIQSNKKSKITGLKNNQLKAENSSSVFLSKISFGNEDTFDYESRLNEKLKKMNKIKKKFFWGTTKATQATNQELFEFRTKKCDEAESRLNMKENRLTSKEKALRNKENELNAKQEQLTKKENSLISREKGINVKENQLLEQERAVTSRETKSALKEKELNLKQEKIIVKNNELTTKENALIIRENKIKTREGELQLKENLLNTKENELTELENELNFREENIKIKENDLTARENELKPKEEAVVKKRAEATQIKNEGIQMKEDALQIRTEALIAKRQAIKLKEEAVGIEEESFYERFHPDQAKKERAKILEEKEALFNKGIQDSKSQSTQNTKLKKEIDDLKSQLQELKLKNTKENENAAIIKQQAEEIAKRDSTIKNLQNEIISLKANKTVTEEPKIKPNKSEIVPQSNIEVNSKSLVNEIKNDQMISIPEIKNGFGWNRIAGFEDIKYKFDEMFINKLAMEQKGSNIELHNGIFLYGPTGTGKSLIVRALAEESGCHFVEIDLKADSDEIYENIVKEAKKAKENYISNNKLRTILFLDNINLTKRKPGFIENLNHFMSNSAKENKCTVVITSKEPPPAMFANKNGITIKLFIGPPSRENTAKILKFYLKDATKHEINYDKLVDEMLRVRALGQAFSSSSIEKISHECKSTMGRNFTTDDVIKKIGQFCPDIYEFTMNKFSRDIFGKLKNTI